MWGRLTFLTNKKREKKILKRYVGKTHFKKKIKKKMWINDFKLKI